ncbi:MAG: hypothetical protein GX455_07740 [Phycisphaerae bacterium]|nr:hypothetical protein [Phycisphaerae bacterium]
MKKWIALVVVTAIAASSIVALAQEEKKEQPRKEDQRIRARQTRETPVPTAATKPGATVPNTSMDMTSIMENRSKQLQARKATAMAEVDQWKAILKLAEDEKAAKTAEAIKKMIAQKEAEINKEFQAQEEQIKKMQEQMKQRMEEMKKRQDAAKEGKSTTPAIPATPASPASKAAEKGKDKK